MVLEPLTAAALLLVVVLLFVIQTRRSSRALDAARAAAFEAGKRSVVVGHIRLPRQPEFVDVKRMSQKDRDLFFFEFERRCMEALEPRPAEVEFLRQSYAQFVCEHDAAYEPDGEIILIKGGARV